MVRRQNSRYQQQDDIDSLPDRGHGKKTITFYFELGVAYGVDTTRFT